MAARVLIVGILPLSLAVALIAATLPGDAEAQPAPRTYRIGVLANSPSPAWDAFRQRLRALGWVEGHTVSVEWRFSEGKLERLPDFAAELARLNVDVIVATAPPAVRAARQATTTIPIVMTAVADPVGMGFVSSLARPGGNTTGLASVPAGFMTKMLELVKQTVPTASRVGVLFNAANPLNVLTANERALNEAATALKVKLRPLGIRSRDDLPGAFATATREGVDALFVTGDPLTFVARQTIHDLTEQHRLPAIFPTKEFLGDRGLMSYGPNLTAHTERAAFYVDRILRGAKPADLPVEQPREYELVVNLKTAKALGLTIPPSLLAGADEVIE